MKTLIKITVTLLLAIFSLFCLMQIAVQQDIEISNIELIVEKGTKSTITLPLNRDIIGNYQVTMDLRMASWASKQLQIIPDDELLAVKINGKDVSLEAYSKADLRNYTTGIKIQLDGLVEGESNKLELWLKNESNPAGLNVKVTNDLGFVALFLAAIALLVLVYSVSRHITLTSVQYVFLLASLVASLIYLSQTNSSTRTFDVYEGGGHRDYIEYLITHKTTPPPGEGWEYHQPPLYYTLAALSKGVLAGSPLYNDLWGQLLALWFWTIFLMASLAALKQGFVKNSWALWLASATICFWPSGIIHSIRIGNDIPLYAFYALSFYYCLRWWQGRALSHLLYASIWASMALLTKSNALAVWGVIGCLFLVQIYRLWLYRKSRAQQLKKIQQGFLVLTVCFATTIALNFGDNVWHYIQGTSNDWLLSNVSETIHSGLKVANKPINYNVFDTATYLQNPFISSWEDRYGRQYFWNFVWRSALTSEFFFDGKALSVWGIANGVFLMMMLAGIGVYAIQQASLSNKQQIYLSIYRNLPWLLALLMPFLLLLAYRIKVPLSCNTDFRYIYPVLVPLIYFSAKVWNQFPRFKLSWLLATGAPLIALSSWVWLALL